MSMTGEDRTVLAETLDRPATGEPAGVPTRRLVRALARIRRDGVMHEPGTASELLAVDAKTHAELVVIGAVAAVSWDALEVEPVPMPIVLPEEPTDPRPGPAGAVK